MKPTDLPEWRDRQLEFYRRRDHALKWWTTTNSQGFFGGLVQASDVGTEAAFDLEVNRWRAGELFYVTEEMGAIAAAAAESMPTYDLRPEDLPSPYGVMYFAGDTLGRTHDLPVNWIAWGPTTLPTGRGGHQMGNWVSVYTDPRVGLRVRQPDLPEQQYRRALGVMAPLAYDDEFALLYGSEDIDREKSGTFGSGMVGGWQLLVRCTWLLMQQRVVSMADITLPRQSRRKLERSPEPLTRARVVQLRGAESAPDREPGQSAREYVHRWFVRGHWRKQWYPSEERHKPIWVAPYLKGPDGAPLLGGDKVYAWTR